MVLLPTSVRILLATEPCDMRKSIDGLMAIVRSAWGEDVFVLHRPSTGTQSPQHRSSTLGT